MTIEDVAEAIMSSIADLTGSRRAQYAQTAREKNICGKVLSMCDLDELKSELEMTFGDWLLFKTWVMTKRTERAPPPPAPPPTPPTHSIDLSRNNSLRFSTKQLSPPRQQPQQQTKSPSKDMKQFSNESLSNIPEIRTSEYVESQQQQQQDVTSLLFGSEDATTSATRDDERPLIKSSDASSLVMFSDAQVQNNNEEEEEEDEEEEEGDEEEEDNEEGNLLDPNKRNYPLIIFFLI